MLDIDRDISRGQQADQILSSEMFRELYEAEIAATILAIRESRTTDANGREIAYMYLRALDRIKARFEAVRDSGRIAQRQRDQATK